MSKWKAKSRENSDSYAVYQLYNQTEHKWGNKKMFYFAHREQTIKLELAVYLMNE